MKEPTLRDAEDFSVYRISLISIPFSCCDGKLRSCLEEDKRKRFSEVEIWQCELRLNTMLESFRERKSVFWNRIPIPVHFKESFFL